MKVAEEKENDDSARAIDLGDRKEEQLFFGERVRKWHSERAVQQRTQQSLQSQHLQVLW